MKRFKRINFKDDAVSRFQGNCGESFDALTSIPLLDGVRVDNVVVLTTTTSVAHGLGREPRGWIIVGKDSIGDVFEVSRSATFLVLDTSANVTIDLWVF